MRLYVEDLPAFTEADGRVKEYLDLAAKALQAGKWEKALAYGTMAQAWQGERDEARKGLR
jgi:hypothetical protein